MSDLKPAIIPQHHQLRRTKPLEHIIYAGQSDGERRFLAYRIPLNDLSVMDYRPISRKFHYIRMATIRYYEDGERPFKKWFHGEVTDSTYYYPRAYVQDLQQIRHELDSTPNRLAHDVLKEQMGGETAMIHDPYTRRIFPKSEHHHAMCEKVPGLLQDYLDDARFFKLPITQPQLIIFGQAGDVSIWHENHSTLIEQNRQTAKWDVIPVKAPPLPVTTSRLIAL